MLVEEGFSKQGPSGFWGLAQDRTPYTLGLYPLLGWAGAGWSRSSDAPSRRYVGPYSPRNLGTTDARVWLLCACVYVCRLHLFNGPDMMALPGVKPLVDFMLGVGTQLGPTITAPFRLRTFATIAFPLRKIVCFHKIVSAWAHPLTAGSAGAICCIGIDS
jgi:hypothetical protein